MTTGNWHDYDYNELVDIVSDYSKSLYGYRTRMNGATREELIAELYRLDEDAPRVAQAEHEAEQRHIARFEGLVADRQALLNYDRRDAIHSLLEEEDYENDYDYGCYLYNLPYGYFKDVQREAV